MAERVPRLAVGGDLGAIKAIVHAAYAPYIARIGREPGPMLDDYHALVRDGRVHVVEQGGVVRGLLVLREQPDALLLDNVAVSPLAQGMGLGRILLAFAEAVARASGYQTIKLYTNEAMSENRLLYARNGYIETHRAVERGLRRVFMTKKLD